MHSHYDYNKVIKINTLIIKDNLLNAIKKDINSQIIKILENNIEIDEARKMLMPLKLN